MSTLAPKQSDQISYERPVGAAPSVLEALAGTAMELGSDFMAARASSGNVSATDAKNNALRPIIAAADQIATSDKSQAEKNRLMERLYRNSLRENAAYRTDIDGIFNTSFGWEPGQGDTGRILQDQFQEWLASPKGVNAAAEVKIVGASQGETDAAGEYERLYSRFLEDNAQQARIARFADKEADDKIVWAELSPQWQKDAIAAADGLAINASSNPELLKQPEQVLTLLDNQIRAFENTVRTEASAAGMTPKAVEEQIAQVIQPLQDLRSMYHSQMENPGRLLDAVSKGAELNMTRNLIRTYGPHAANPEFRQYFFDTWLKGQITAENAERFFDTMEEMAANEEFNSWNLSVPTMPGVSDAITQADVDVVSPDTVSRWRQNSQDNPDYIADRISNAVVAISQADVQTPEGRGQALLGLQHMAIASAAYEGPVGAETMRLMFSPQSLRNIEALGDEGRSMLGKILMEQVRFHRTYVENNSSTLLRDHRVVLKDGRLVAQRRGRFGTTDWETTNSGEMAKHADAINTVLSISSRFPELKTKIGNSIGWHYRGIEPTNEQIDNEDISWSDLENVQYTSHQAPNALIPLIDRTEGGGEYDTLFGFSQRGNGRFAGVKIDEMTIGEALRFADVNGEYGQWVKEELRRNGHRARVATPMGRYQIVGTTLRQTAMEMGLSEDVVFNKKTQDAMFHHLANKAIRGKSGAAARTALRNEWEGFKYVSDAELDAAIASFKGQPAPTFDQLDRAVGGPNFGVDAPTPGPSRSNGFMAMAEAIGETDAPAQVRAREFNPTLRDSDSTGASLNVEEQRRGSRAASRDSRAQAFAALRAAGMSEQAIREVLGEEDA